MPYCVVITLKEVGLSNTFIFDTLPELFQVQADLVNSGVEFSVSPAQYLKNESGTVLKIGKKKIKANGKRGPGRPKGYSPKKAREAKAHKEASEIN